MKQNSRQLRYDFNDKFKCWFMDDLRWSEEEVNAFKDAEKAFKSGENFSI
jgi:hypothetical protein